jgi:hypothetical protein
MSFAVGGVTEPVYRASGPGGAEFPHAGVPEIVTPAPPTLNAVLTQSLTVKGTEPSDNVA